jgi:hypothetical protein
MSEASKIVDEALGFLRGFPRPFRIIALVLLLVPFAMFLHDHYNWPYSGLVKDSVWMNSIGSVFIVAVLFILAWYSPRPAMSASQLPDTKPIFSESLKYFKEGPELKGPRGDLLKDVQNKFESSADPNPFELPWEQMQACMVSAWDFDRVVFYLFERYRERSTLDERIRRVKHEMRLLNTRNWQGSLTPLHYAVESVYPGLFEKEPVPKFSSDQLEPFREILGKLNSLTARLRGLFTGLRGEGIIKNCRSLIQAETNIK